MTLGNRMEAMARHILRDEAPENPAPRRSNPLDGVGHWTQAVLLERVAYLRQMARYGNGNANETLRAGAGYQVELWLHGRSSDAEIDADHALQISIVAGTATLVTGRDTENARLELRQGDAVHVPPGVPWQIVITGEKPVACLVVRMRQIEL